MSDCYEVLIDTSATHENAQERATLLRSVLLSAGIISAETSSQSVLNGIGHLPGPKLANMYQFAEGSQERPPELNYWQDLTINGVEIIQEKWVNFFGFTVFHWTRCPECEIQFDDGHCVIDSLIDASANFFNAEGSCQVQCPTCKKSSDVRRWKTKPHLGHCYVAAVFWNWPSFDSPGWQVSMTEVVSQAMGVPMKYGFGRVQEAFRGEQKIVRDALRDEDRPSDSSAIFRNCCWGYSWKRCSPTDSQTEIKDGLRRVLPRPGQPWH